MAFDPGKAFRVFRQVVECLDANFKNKYFIVDGTLLGYVRCGDFVPKDYDIDFGMWIEDYDPAIIDDFKQAGFVHYKTLGTLETGFQLKFKRDGIFVDLVFYYRDEHRIWNIVFPGWARYRAVYPVFGLKPVVFNGVEIMAPSPPESYLEAVYGPDWRRPVQRWDYRFMCYNFESLNGPVIDAIYWLKMKNWRWKYPDVYQRRDGSHAKTVYTDGVFDLFHVNHSLLLQEARAEGDMLVVGVVSDKMAQTYKRKPVIPEQERLRIVQSQKSVDMAFILHGECVQETLDKVIAEYHIDKIVYAGEELDKFSGYYDTAIKGGFFKHLPYHSGANTSQIIARKSRKT